MNFTDRLKILSDLGVDHVSPAIEPAQNHELYLTWAIELSLY